MRKKWVLWKSHLMLNGNYFYIYSIYTDERCKSHFSTLASTQTIILATKFRPTIKRVTNKLVWHSRIHHDRRWINIQCFSTAHLHQNSVYPVFMHELISDCNVCAHNVSCYNFVIGAFLHFTSLGKDGWLCWEAWGRYLVEKSFSRPTLQ